MVLSPPTYGSEIDCAYRRRSRLPIGLHDFADMPPAWRDTIFDDYCMRRQDDFSQNYTPQRLCRQPKPLSFFVYGHIVRK